MKSLTDFDLTPELIAHNFSQLIEAALIEDSGEVGDVTTQAIIPSTQQSSASIISKAVGIVAGMDVVELVMHRVDPRANVTALVTDGQAVTPGQELVTITGSTSALLQAERTMLNFLQHLSGIATLTGEFVAQTVGTPTKVMDTRKTLPGWRILEKYAVRMGGGFNHRMGLFDMILIKNNHIDAAGGVAAAIERVLSSQKTSHLQIEVEVRDLKELGAALRFPVNLIMLDNMSNDQISEAVALTKGQVPLEVSGNVTQERVKTLAQLGVQYVSVGALTHSAPALDISMRIKMK